MSVPSATSPAQIRRKTCADLLPRLEEVRQRSGQQGVDDQVHKAIANLADTPDWPVFTPNQRQAAIAGVHDAATGHCP
ncbi:hypothetical protein NDR87_36930 [Nocardia sp. CDC159]|uniref:Uncharacterized protein n=1 Tax=Nocardia pulmonis TaxID=2951408 RepID=A0A9X2EI48_9NOCA|nr:MULTISPECIES: hypothetical protein [Nocardia]MCM6779073.1 hypothetical protein [Nocardia pulmonis]MCM6791963.1 hypothetical protein [Nocardia sp. CDC159]